MFYSEEPLDVMCFKFAHRFLCVQLRLVCPVSNRRAGAKKLQFLAFSIS